MTKTLWFTQEIVKIEILKGLFRHKNPVVHMLPKSQKLKKGGSPLQKWGSDHQKWGPGHQKWGPACHFLSKSRSGCHFLEKSMTNPSLFCQIHVEMMIRTTIPARIIFRILDGDREPGGREDALVIQFRVNVSVAAARDNWRHCKCIMLPQ